MRRGRISTELLMCGGIDIIIMMMVHSLVPPISKTCANSFFDRSLVYAAPTLWNALDLDIRLLPFDTFKKVSRHIFI